MEAPTSQNINLEKNNQISKGNNFLTFLLSFLLLFACLIAFFFYQQKQNISLEILKYRQNLNNTPIPDNNKQNPYNNWRVYENKERSFSFKFPSNFIYPDEIIPQDSNHFATRINLDGPREVSNNELLLEVGIYTNLDRNSALKVEKAIENTEVGSKTNQPFQPIGEITKIYNVKNGSVFKEANPDAKEATYYIAIWNLNNYTYTLKLFGYNQTLEDSNETFNNIVKSVVINTIDDKQVFCTMDAKICPDGSAVGRSGPKCEFDPCPTPKSVSTSPLP